MGRVEIEIVSVEKELIKAIKMIDRFLRLNKINFKYSIAFDFNYSQLGFCYPGIENKIYINPKNCAQSIFLYRDCFPRFSEDCTIFGVALHEFCHLIDHKFDLTDSYKILFSEKFPLNPYAHVGGIYEEVAEILSLYMTNPYFLKLINFDIFDFFRERFKSPTECSQRTFLRFYKKWPKHIQEICKSQWGIEVSGNIVKNLS